MPDHFVCLASSVWEGWSVSAQRLAALCILSPTSPGVIEGRFFWFFIYLRSVKAYIKSSFYVTTCVKRVQKRLEI